MEKNDKPKYRKKAILSVVLASILFASSYKPSEDANVIVTMKEKKEEEYVKPTVEVEEEKSWILAFDENSCMYKVDLDKFLKDRLKLEEVTLENGDFINLMELVRQELGEDFYIKSEDDNTLYNLDGKTIKITASYGKWIEVKFYGYENPFVYEIHVGSNGKTDSMSKTTKIEEGSLESKYFIIYSDDKEVSRSILLRENAEKYLSVYLHKAYNILDEHYISFDSNIAEAKIKLSNEEYNTLHEIMLLYSDSDNLLEFFRDNVDLLNKYLDLIKEKNAEYYEYLCRLINEYTEEKAILRYE